LLGSCFSYFRDLQEIQAHYDEVHRQLQVTVDQYGVAQRKLQALTSELEEIRSNYESVSVLGILFKIFI
jgi:septation ring formation regulator EzrA